MCLYMIIMFLKGYSTPFRVVTSEEEDGRAWGGGGRIFHLSLSCLALIFYVERELIL